MSDTQCIYRVRRRDITVDGHPDDWVEFTETGDGRAEDRARYLARRGLEVEYADVEWKPMPPDGDEPSRMRPIEADFYFDRTNQVWVYRWSDDRLVLRDAPEPLPPKRECSCIHYPSAPEQTCEVHGNQGSLMEPPQEDGE